MFRHEDVGSGYDEFHQTFMVNVCPPVHRNSEPFLVNQVGLDYNFRLLHHVGSFIRKHNTGTPYEGGFTHMAPSASSAFRLSGSQIG